MPYGSPNGGSGPASGGATPMTQQQRAAASGGGVEIKDKSISYNAANSEQILNIKTLSTVTTTKENKKRSKGKTNA